MDTDLSVAIIAASATMVTGISGMWINASHTGKRIDELSKRIDDLRADYHAFRVEVRSELKELRTELKDLRTELTTFKEVVNGKLQAIDFEIAKLMDRPK